MINTTTLVHRYVEFCKQGTIPVKATPDGFVKLVTNSFFFPVFVAFVLKEGYTIEQFEKWEKETFNGNSETFFKDVEYAFKMLEE